MNTENSKLQLLGMVSDGIKLSDNELKVVNDYIERMKYLMHF